MGLRSPQEMQKVQIAKEPGARFQGAVAPNVDPKFLNTIESGLAVKAKAEDEAAKFIKKDYSNKAEQLRIEAQGFLSQVNGVDSADEYKKQEEKLHAKISELSQSYSEKYRPILQLEGEQFVNKYRSYGVPYVHGQTNKVRNEAFKIDVANQINNAVEVSGHDEAFSNSLLKVEESARDAAIRAYGNNELLVNNAVENTRSETVMQSISTQAKMGRIDNGQVLFEKHKDLMTPSHQVKAFKALQDAKNAGDNRIALDVVNEAFKQYPDSPEMREKFLNETAPSAKEYERRMRIDARQTQIQKQQKEIDQNSSMEKLYEGINKGKQMDMAEFNKLDAKNQAKVLKHSEALAGKGLIVTDEVTYQNASDTLYGATQLSDLPKTFSLDALRFSVGQDRMKELEVQYRRLQQAEGNQAMQAQLRGFAESKKVVKDISTSLGIFNPIQRGQLSYLANKYWGEMVDQYPKENTAQIRNRVIDKIQKEGYTTIKTPTGWTKYNPFSRNRGKDFSEKRVVNQDLLKKETPVPHPSVIKLIKSQRPGMTDSEINEYLQFQASKGVDITRPR